MRTVFLRALDATDKAAALLTAIHEPDAARFKQRFDVKVTSFAFVPRTPFAYWVSEEILKIFKSFESLNHDGRLVVSTNPLNDDFRYVRAWWEVAARDLGHKWRPWAKGGAYSPFYYDIDTVICWDAHRSTYAGFLGTENRPLERPASVQHFFRPALTWPRRTNGLSLRAMPKGCIFADKGPAVFVDNDNSEDLLALAAITNSHAFNLLVSLQLARTELAQSYEVGLIQSTPIPRLSSQDRGTLANLARRAWALKRSLNTRTEVSHAFLLPVLLQVDGADLNARAAGWAAHARGVVTELTAIRREIDARCFDLYGIDERDQRAIAEGFRKASEESAEEADCNSGSEMNDDEETEYGVESLELAAELASWSVGVCFGRFDVRIATGTQAARPEPEPFDPLPARSPAMLADDDGPSVAGTPHEYPLSFPEDGILVDDPGHARDLTAATRTVFDEVFGASADTWWADVGALLDPKGHDLRSWFTSSFFEHHLKRHSKSRRKAPIIWELTIPSGRYRMWLNSHRLTRDSFFKIQNDVVAPKLAHEERRLVSLMQDVSASTSAKQRKETAEQEAFVGELRSFLDQVRSIAPLWNPTPDDGVVLSMAPLWCLVPLHKPWQRELKSKWDELAAGKYDWAHVAMHLWPERVVLKCTADRSLAIAHDLEDVFWAEGDDGKWARRSVPTRSVDELVRERSSVAVKAALKELSEASVPNGSKARTRRSSL
jgi:hypothetical protein